MVSIYTPARDMDTRLENEDMKNRKSLSRQMFVTVLVLFSVFVLGFVAYQYQREKQFKIGILHTRLKDYNHQLIETLGSGGELSDSVIASYIRSHPLRGLRVTLFDSKGKVFYDNENRSYSTLPNHLERPEIKQALLYGEGFVINRHSNTMNENYFYAATYSPQQELIVRTALPYDFELAEHLRADMTYIWIALAASIVIITFFWLYVRRLGKAIAQLRRFAMLVDSGRSYDDEYETLSFPDNELGEISQNIVRLYKRLQQSQDEQLRIKRQLTQNISHELKTPVASIYGYLETIVENPELTDAQRKTFIERCFAQSKRLTSLVQDISSLNRMDEVLHSLNFQLTDIAEIVSGIQQEVALQLEEKRMTVTNTLDTTLPIKGDPSMLYSIFRNLIDNSIAYSGEGTAVVIRCLEESDRYHFRLSDNGAGIPAEHIPHIFERFYRVDKGRNRKFGGTGLGLSIVKNAVMVHGGTITAVPVDTGGVEFRFTLLKDVTRKKKA